MWNKERGFGFIAIEVEGEEEKQHLYFDNRAESPENKREPCRYDVINFEGIKDQKAFGWEGGNRPASKDDERFCKPLKGYITDVGREGQFFFLRDEETSKKVFVHSSDVLSGTGRFH